MTSLVEDDWEVVCHDMLVPCCRPNRDLIEGDPVLEVFLAVVFFKFLELKIAWPNYLLEM